MKSFPLTILCRDYMRGKITAHLGLIYVRHEPAKVVCLVEFEGLRAFFAGLAGLAFVYQRSKRI